MPSSNDHAVPRCLGGTAKNVKRPTEKQRVETIIAEGPVLKGILKKSSVAPKDVCFERSSTRMSVDRNASTSLVEVISSSGVREMMPLSEVDPAVCEVGGPIECAAGDSFSSPSPSSPPSSCPSSASASSASASAAKFSTDVRRTDHGGGGATVKIADLFRNAATAAGSAGMDVFDEAKIARRTANDGAGDTGDYRTGAGARAEAPRVATPPKHAGASGKSLVDEAKYLLEFYLDDKTALRDELLVKQIRRWSGWISLNFMATYGKLRTLTGSHMAVDILKEAVKASNVLELSDDETKVRRLIPFPTYDETFASRTVVQVRQDLPENHSAILNVFKMFGQVYAIYIMPRMLCVPCALPDAPEIVVTNVRKFLTRNLALLDVEWKSLAFVEFASHRAAETALFVLTRMAFRGSGCGGSTAPILLPVKPHPQMQLKLNDPQEMSELTRALGLALQADDDRKQSTEPQGQSRPPPSDQRDYCHGDHDPGQDDGVEGLCVRRAVRGGKSLKEAIARDPAIVDCGLPVAAPRPRRDPTSAPELREAQVTRQKLAWEPCVACQLLERGLYNPIAHAFTLRYAKSQKSPAIPRRYDGSVKRRPGFALKLNEPKKPAEKVAEAGTPAPRQEPKRRAVYRLEIRPPPPEYGNDGKRRGEHADDDDDEKKTQDEQVKSNSATEDTVEPGKNHSHHHHHNDNDNNDHDDDHDHDNDISDVEISPIAGGRVYRSYYSSSNFQSPSTSGYITDENLSMNYDEHGDEVKGRLSTLTATTATAGLKPLDDVEE